MSGFLFRHLRLPVQHLFVYGTVSGQWVKIFDYRKYGIKYFILLTGVQLLCVILNNVYSVKSANIILGLVTNTVAQSYTDFNS